MKVFWIGLLMLSAPAFAQHGGGLGTGDRGFGAGRGAASGVHPRFGGVFVGPGIGFRAPRFSGQFGLPQLTPIPPLGGEQLLFGRGPHVRRRFGSQGLPWFSPVWWPGYFGEAAYSYEPEPSLIVVQPPAMAQYSAPAQLPPLKPAKPVVHEYHFTASEATPLPVEQRAYVIALKDGSRAAAIAVWVEGRTLHYIDRDDNAHHVALSDVDRALTQKLNREQQLPLSLPGVGRVPSPDRGH